MPSWALARRRSCTMSPYRSTPPAGPGRPLLAYCVTVPAGASHHRTEQAQAHHASPSPATSTATSPTPTGSQHPLPRLRTHTRPMLFLTRWCTSPPLTYTLACRCCAGGRSSRRWWTCIAHGRHSAEHPPLYPLRGPYLNVTRRFHPGRTPHDLFRTSMAHALPYNSLVRRRCSVARSWRRWSTCTAPLHPQPPRPLYVKPNAPCSDFATLSCAGAVPGCEAQGTGGFARQRGRPRLHTHTRPVLLLTRWCAPRCFISFVRRRCSGARSSRRWWTCTAAGRGSAAR